MLRVTEMSVDQREGVPFTTSTTFHTHHLHVLHSLKIQERIDSFLVEFVVLLVHSSAKFIPPLYNGENTLGYDLN